MITTNLSDFTTKIGLTNGQSLIYTAIVCVILTILLTIVYVIIIIKAIATAPKNTSTLNIESIEYASIYNLTFINNGKYSFNYTYFWVILLGIALIALGVFYKFYNTTLPIRRVVFIALIALFLALVLQIITMIFCGKIITKIRNQAEALNTHIRTNIYKNGEFLKKLRIPKTDVNDKYNTIAGCVAMLKNERSTTELAKAFYTLTLYNYFNEFSSNNMSNYEGAYALFDIIALTDQKHKINSSAYMPRYGTFIEDIGESIIRKHISPSSMVNEAIYKCDIMVSITNEKANTIYPDEAYNVFILMLVVTILINALLVGSVYFYGIKGRTFLIDNYQPVQDNRV